MVDTDFNTWLIEINASPAMDYSTVSLTLYAYIEFIKEITKRLVKTVLPDTMKVVIDYNYAKKADKPNIDTGLFTKIYKGEEINPGGQKKNTIGGQGV